MRRRTPAGTGGPGDALKNLLLAGLGAVGYSQDKLKEVVNTLIERGQLSREQGEKVISEWVDRGKEEQERVTDRVGEELKNAISKLPVVMRDEFQALEARVEELEQKLAGE